MKLEKGAKKRQRTYRQTARAEAAAATAQAITNAFLKRLQDQWLEDITLDAVAQDAGVTVQTVIRRFGGKASLLKAAIQEMDKSIHVRRAIRPGDVDFSVEVLSNDYDEIGDLILRLLAQEDRHPDLKPVLDNGRQGHRSWLASVFSQALKPLTPAVRKSKLDALVVATDIYIWKLLRRDMGRPPAAFKSIVKIMLHGVLGSS